MQSKLRLTESHKSFDRYECSYCKGEMLIGGANISKYCYNCVVKIVNINKRNYYKKALQL